MMLHFLVKILCGLTGFCSLEAMGGVLMAISLLVRGVLNIPPEDMSFLAVIRFDSTAVKAAQISLMM